MLGDLGYDTSGVCVPPSHGSKERRASERQGWQSRQIQVIRSGQLDEGEVPRAAVRREIAEESGLAVMVGKLLLADIFGVLPGREVLIIAFRCSVRTARSTAIKRSAEHRAMEWVPLSEIDDIRLPEIYRRAIAEAI